jgi:O-antigen/teichoic acid export membrane protein
LFDLNHLKAFTLSFLQRASLPFFGFASFYILVRKLSEQDMGQWALFITITASLEGAKNGLINNALVHYLNASPDTKEHISIKSSSLVLNFVVSLIFALLIVFFSNMIGDVFEAKDLPAMLRIYAVIMMVLVLFSHFTFIQQSFVSYVGILLGSVARQGTFFFFLLVSMVILDISSSLQELVFVQMAGVLLGTFVTFLYARRFMKLRFQFRREWFSKNWAYGRYGMFTNISVSIITTTDHLMLGGMISTASVAVYNVAVRITQFFNLPTVTLSGVLLPKGIKTAMGEDPSQLKALFEKAVAVSLAVVIPMVTVVLCFPTKIIIFIASDTYLDSVAILIVLILTTLIRPFFQNYGLMVNAIGKPVLDFIFVFIISLLNIVANYFMINYYGIIGAAYASLLTHIAGLIFIVIVLKSMIEIELIAILRQFIGTYVGLFNFVKSSIFK